MVMNTVAFTNSHQLETRLYKSFPFEKFNVFRLRHQDFTATETHDVLPPRSSSCLKQPIIHRINSGKRSK